MRKVVSLSIHRYLRRRLLLLRSFIVLHNHTLCSSEICSLHLTNGTMGTQGPTPVLRLCLEYSFNILYMFLIVVETEAHRKALAQLGREPGTF